MDNWKEFRKEKANCTKNISNCKVNIARGNTKGIRKMDFVSLLQIRSKRRLQKKKMLVIMKSFTK